MSINFENWNMVDAIIALWYAAKDIDGSKNQESPTQEMIMDILYNNKNYIDYLKGCSLKISVESWPYVDSELYNRENGDNVMQKVALSRQHFVSSKQQIRVSQRTNKIIDTIAMNPLIAQQTKDLYAELFM